MIDKIEFHLVVVVVFCRFGHNVSLTVCPVVGVSSISVVAL